MRAHTPTPKPCTNYYAQFFLSRTLNPPEISPFQTVLMVAIQLVISAIRLSSLKPITIIQITNHKPVTLPFSKINNYLSLQSSESHCCWSFFLYEPYGKYIEMHILLRLELLKTYCTTFLYAVFLHKNDNFRYIIHWILM